MVTHVSGTVRGTPPRGRRMVPKTVQPLRAGSASILRRVHRLMRVCEREFGTQRSEPRRFPSRPPGRRTLKKAADEHAERQSACDGRHRMLLGEGDELVLGLDGRFAGTIDDRRTAKIGMAGLPVLNLLLELGAVGITHEKQLLERLITAKTARPFTRFLLVFVQSEEGRQTVQYRSAREPQDDGSQTCRDCSLVLFGEVDSIVDHIHRAVAEPVANTAADAAFFEVGADQRQIGFDQRQRRVA
ncbi:MAG TPA: hypothetical protein VKY80_12135 [Croceibacterium sp.]|nr:hypothetical protein [Croceibacterium sp.]